MNRKIEQWIPTAIQAIRDNMMEEGSLAVSAKYKGYISSLAASMVQSGVLSALSFYAERPSQSKDKSSTKWKRIKMLNALKAIIINQSLLKGELDNNHDLLSMTMKYIDPTVDLSNEKYNFGLRYNYNHSRAMLIQSEIQDATVALKMALRIFESKDDID